MINKCDNVINKLVDLNNQTLNRENTQYLACNGESVFFFLLMYTITTTYRALAYLLDSIFIRFGTKLYRQTIGIPMGTNCTPLVADLFLFCLREGS